MEVWLTGIVRILCVPLSRFCASISKYRIDGVFIGIHNATIFSCAVGAPKCDFTQRATDTG